MYNLERSMHKQSAALDDTIWLNKQYPFDNNMLKGVETDLWCV